MTTSYPIKAAFSQAQVSDHTGAGAAYAPLGNPSPVPIHIAIITSTFNQAVYLSTNGSTDMLLVPGRGTVINIDISSNKQGTSKFAFPAGTQLYLKQGPDGAPTSGDICVTGIYGT